ncbi:hypothetical protein GIB67_031452 [Kingdonia uniflora]|uniref:Uncharacterized protein n=1 Tax=Kingdonia uniflora TaxID=39325 RepID=A0A7J7MBH6_9MAGN|nr:hypothetical protein GIB67_031452 [Kingdonia uniflora]
MPKGEPHPSTLPGFRGRRDPERFLTRSRSGRKKKRVEFEDVQPQDIPNPTEDNFPRRCITQLPDGVSHIYYTGKELTYWFYEYCAVGHPIVKEEVKYPAYPRLRAWEKGNRRKTNDQAANLFIIGRYHIDHRTVETITWEPWFDSAVYETEDALNAKLLSCKRIPLQVLNGNCEYYLGDRCWRQVTGEVGHMLTDSQRMGNLDMFGPSTLRAGIAPVVVTSVSVHSLSQDFSLPGEAEGPDLGWHMQWTGRQSARDAQRIQEVEEELVIPRRQLDSIDHQLYAHDLQLRRGRDVRVVPLPPGGGARTRQRRSSLRTREGSTSRRRRGTGDDSV